MELAQEALKDIVSSGDVIKNLVGSLLYEDEKVVDKKLTTVMDDFDLKFFKFQSLLPNAKRKNKNKAIKLSGTAMVTFKKRFERITARYSNEIEQSIIKYRHIKEIIVGKTDDQCNIIYNEEEKLKKDIKRKKKELAQKIKEMNDGAEEKINKMKLEILEKSKEAEVKTKDSLEELQKKFELIESRGKSLRSSLEKEIAEIYDDMSSLSMRCVERNNKNEEHHKERMKKIEEQKMEEIGEVVALQDNVKAQIQKERDKIKVIADRLDILKKIYARKLNEMTTTLTNNAKQHIKSLTISINTTVEKTKLIDTDIMMSKREYEDKVAEELKNNKETIDEELKKRESVLNSIRAKKENEYSSKIENLNNIIKKLRDEIDKNNNEMLPIIVSTQNEMRARISEVKATNEKEISTIQNEIEKIMSSKDKISLQTSTLEESTNEIFFSTSNNLRIELEAQTKRHEKEIEEMKSKEPERITQDYEEYIKNEIKRMEEEFINQESLLEHDKMVALSVKGEEEKSKGYLTTRRQNAPEIQALRETEIEMKNKLHKLEIDSKYDCREAEANYHKEVDKIKNEHNKAILSITNKHNQKVILLTSSKNKEKQRADENRTKLHESRILNEDLKQRAKLADDMNAKIPEQMKEKAKERREQLLEIMRDKNFDLTRETRKLEEIKEELVSKISNSETSINKSIRRLDNLKKEFEETLEEKRQQQEDKYETLIKEQQQIYDQIFEQIESNQRTMTEDITERTNAMLNMIENEKNSIDTYKKETQSLIEMRKNQMIEEHMKVVKEIKAKNEEEKKLLQIEIDNEAFEMKKESCWKEQDNRMDLVRKFEVWQKNIKEKQDEVDELMEKLEALQNKLDKKMNSSCKVCPKLDDEIDFIKHDIVDIVTKMQEFEAVDANRNFIATHFGSGSKSFPSLKSMDKKEEEKDSTKSEKGKKETEEEEKGEKTKKEEKKTKKDKEHKAKSGLAKSIKKKEKRNNDLKSTITKPKKLIRKKQDKNFID